MGLFFCDDLPRHYDDVKEAAENGRYPKFFHGLLERGIALAPGPYEAVFPSLAHSDADIDHTIDVAAEVAVNL